MEYMPIDLDKVIVACHGHFPLSLQLSILLDVSLGMQYLHAKGIVHCDLTPDNILLSSALDAKIGDLGCTHILGSKDMSGYPQDLNPRYWAYMPPQVFNINFKYTEKLDVFSFGALTLFVATQTFPERYMGSEVSEGARERNEVEIERHRSISTILDKENCLLFMIRKCLRDKEEDRPTSNEVTRCMKHWARTHPKKLEDVVLVNNQLQNKLVGAY
jgi:serine/threonine protein kinase